MKKITQPLEYREIESEQHLARDLINWSKQHPPINAGVNYEFEYKWAILSNEDHLAFILKHPEYSHKFTEV